MKQFGIAAWLSFKDRASAAMGRVGAAAETLGRRFRGLRAGVAAVTQGIGQMALATAPVGLGLLKVIKVGARFEQSIARLRSKMLGGFDPALRAMAESLGATTVFSASQAADAMTNLAQAGFSANEVMAATPGVLAAAAAEGMSLATAADIVAGNVRAFGISAAESARVAGILALASSRANTDMVGLNEGLKLAAPIAGIVGAKLSDVTAVLGALADVGLKGTLSGTAFRASMSKLLKPTKETRGAIASLGLSLTSLRKLLDRGDVVGTFQAIVGRLAKIPKASKRASVAVKLFGLRGVALANALKQGDVDLKRFNSTLTALRNESGKTAERMAKIQLSTLTGQMTLLKSAAEGVAIQFFKLAAPQLSSGVKGVSETLGDFALALRVVSGAKFTDERIIKKVAGLSDEMLNFAEGVRNAFVAVREAVVGVGRAFGRLIARFKALPEDTQRKIGKIATTALLVVGVVGPLVAGFGLFVMLAKSAIAVFAGLLTPMIAIPAALGAIAVAIVGPKRALDGLKNAFQAVKDVFVGVRDGFRSTGAFKVLGQAASELWAAFSGLLGSIFALFGTEANFRSFGGTVGKVLGGMLKVVGRLVTILARAIKLVTKLGSWLGDAGMTGMMRDLSKKGILGKASPEVQARLGTAATGSDVLGATKGLLSSIGDLGDDVGLGVSKRAETKAPKVARDAMVSRGGFLPVSAGDVVLDRASLAAGLNSQMRGGLAARASGGRLGGGDPGQTTPPPASPPANVRVEVPVMVDGRQVALAVANARLDDVALSGGRLDPGDRSSLLTRGFAEEV